MVSKKVSVIMPVLNEETHIKHALRSLIEGSYPQELLEFVIVDGGSSDNTVEIVNEIFDSVDIRLILLTNLRKITPASLNMAVNASTNDVILRADGHAIYDKDYILNSVTALSAGDGDNVGGNVLSTPAASNFSGALAKVLNSLFGNGGANYRSSSVAAYVDTVWCGCWYKKTLIDAGLFNEACQTNQDAELNARLISNGYKVRYDPSIKASLIVRDSYWAMLRQYFHYGIGRCRTYRLHPSSIKLRQVFPILFTLGLLVLSGVYPAFFLFLVCSIILIWTLERFFGLPHYLWFIPIVLGMNTSWAIGFVKHYCLDRVAN